MKREKKMFEPHVYLTLNHTNPSVETQLKKAKAYN